MHATRLVGSQARQTGRFQPPSRGFQLPRREVKERAIVPVADNTSEADSDVESVRELGQGPSQVNLDIALNEVRRPRARGKTASLDIPEEDIEEGELTDEFFEKLSRLDTLTVSKLQKQYNDLGFVADEFLPRDELKCLVRDAQIYRVMRLPALQRVCAQEGLETDENQTREQLLHLLADSTWEKLGIPVARFPSVEVAGKVLQQVREFENCSISELKDNCRRWGLPTDAIKARVTPEKLAAQLKQAHIWNRLPLHELRRDCKARSVSTNVDAALSKDETKKVLLERLIASVPNCTPEMRGIPVHRLGSAEVVDKLLEQLDRLQNMGTLSLKAECYKMNIPYNEHVEDQALVDRLRDVLIWQHLPREELLQECERRSLFCLEDDPKDMIIKNLLEDQDRIVEMEALGVPVQFIGDGEAATELLERYKVIETMPTEDLLEWYCSWQLPLAEEMERNSVVKLYKKSMAWEVMPLTDLHQEASSILGMSVSDSDQEDLIHKLLRNECIESMSVEHLCQWYGGLGLYSLQDTDRTAIQNLVKKVLAWEELGPAELLEECSRLQIPHSESSLPEEEDERRALLSRRLAMHESVGVMSLEGLQEWYEQRGLPQQTGVKQQELVKFLKKWIVWDGYSLQEVREECLRLNVAADGSGLPSVDEEQRQVLIHRLLLFECVELLNTDDLLLWYEQLGFPLPKGIRKKYLQELLRRAMAWEARSLDELKQELKDEYGEEVSLEEYGEEASEEELHPVLLQKLVVHARVAGMTPVDLADWYKSTGLPVRGLKRAELAKLLKQVFSWRSMPLSALQQECVRLGVPVDDELEEEERDVLVDELFFQNRMEEWEAKGFQAQRIGDIERARHVVQQYTEFEAMDDIELRQAYVDFGFQDERGLERADCLEKLRAVLIWQALPLPGLLKDCEDRGLPVPEDASEDSLLQLLVNDLLQKRKPTGQGRLAGPKRLPRALDPGANHARNAGSEAMKPPPPKPVDPKPRRTEPEVPFDPVDEGRIKPKRRSEPVVQQQQVDSEGTGAREGAVGRVPRSKPLDSQDEARFEPKRVSQLEPPPPVQLPPRLKDGFCLFINLDRRTDRRVRVEELAAPHAWLRTTLQRVPAVDGRDLNWKQLVADRLFTHKAEETALRAQKEKRPTIGATPLQCSSHLTLGGCGCALSHRKAWQTLVDSDRRWALILEDDVSRVCESFDQELETVMQLLPPGWNMCYLGFHSGQLLAPGTHLRGPLREQRAMDGWLPGLWGYLISKVCARQLIQQAFPMAAQVDTEVCCRVSQRAGCFSVPEHQFLLYSPPTEESGDTDVQTFRKDLH